MCRPCSSAARPRASCSVPTRDHAAHQSSHRSTCPVTRWKSETVTPLVVKRGAQWAIAEATLSSMQAPCLATEIARLPLRIAIECSLMHAEVSVKEAWVTPAVGLSGSDLPDSADVVVLGAGHNGLVCASYLAAAGLEVLVLEARDVAGGSTGTEELTLPGFAHDSCSSAHVLIQSNPLMRDDELGLLSTYGLEYILTDPAVVMPKPDRDTLVLHL